MHRLYEYIALSLLFLFCFLARLCCIGFLGFFFLLLSECSVLYIPSVNKPYQLFTVDVGGLPLK